MPIKQPPIPMETCTFCDGSGERVAHGAGMLLRRERDGRSVTREQLVRHFKKPGGGRYSVLYLIDLERDSRAWSLAMIASYRTAIEAAVAERLELV